MSSQDAIESVYLNPVGIDRHADQLPSRLSEGFPRRAITKLLDGYAIAGTQHALGEQG
jgi:hypothetical protein